MAAMCGMAGINCADLESAATDPPMSNIDFSTVFKTESLPSPSVPAATTKVAAELAQTLEQPAISPEQGSHAKINSVAVAVLSAAAAGLICAFTLFNSAGWSNPTRNWFQDERRGTTPLDAAAAASVMIPSLQNALDPATRSIPLSNATDPTSLISAQTPGVTPASFQPSNNSIGTLSAATPGAPDSLTASLLNSPTASVTAAAQRIAQPLEHQVSVIVEHKVVRVSAAAAIKTVRNQASKAPVNATVKQTAKTQTRPITSTTRSTANVGSTTQSLSASGFSATGGPSSVGSTFSAQSAVQSAGAALGGLGKH